MFTNVLLQTPPGEFPYLEQLQTWLIEWANSPEFFYELVFFLLMLLWLLFLLWMLESILSSSKNSSGEKNAGEGSMSKAETQRQDVDSLIDESEEYDRLLERAAKELEKVSRRQRVEDEQIGMVHTILDMDIFAKRLLQRAGLGHLRPSQVKIDPELVREIARQLPRQLLEVLNAASTQKVIKFDLEQTDELIPVNFPTNTVEPSKMTDLEQLPEILPEDLVLDDEKFFLELAQEELRVQQFYAHRRRQKLLYVLIDDSGSMIYDMRNAQGGLARFVWARGVLLNQLQQAQEGKARFFVRAFTSNVTALFTAQTPEEAAAVIDEVLDMPVSKGNTNIELALVTAIEDIRTKGGDFENAEILLITDGEASVDVATMRQALDDDIKLHTVMIGGHNEALQQLSSTYLTY